MTERAQADSGRLTQLFLSSSNRTKDGTEEQFRPYHLALRAWLADSAPPSLRWTFLDLPDASHSQTPYFSIPDAMWFVHHRAIWELPPPTIDSLFAGTRAAEAAIDDFYSTLSSRVGFILYPEDIDAHLTLANVLARSGDKRAARNALEVALHFAERLAGSERTRSDLVALVRRELEALRQTSDVR